MIIQLIIILCFYIIGITLGSFYTLAIYRIPLKQDIVYTRSYCPKCNHRLEFLDLIPILSYIFLKGQCRYCQNKISKRYIIIEAISGVLYVLLIMVLRINFLNITLDNIVMLIYATLMYSSIFIFLGIVKESHKISKGVLIFGAIVQLLYIIYLYVL